MDYIVRDLGKLMRLTYRRSKSQFLITHKLFIVGDEIGYFI